MLISGGDILSDAYHKGYAVGAFNVINLEGVLAVIRAAEEEQSPVIIQTTEEAIKYAGIDHLASIVRIAAEKTRVPVALHLDRGSSFESCMRCIRAGWTSVMLDASQLSFEENMAATAQVVRAAHACGVSVEAELGRGAQGDGGRASPYTDPEEARAFAVETRVDSLAISIGTALGRNSGDRRLDMDRIPRIKSATNLPLVLHGASGVEDGDLRKTIYLGINKVAIDTDLRVAACDAVKREIKLDSDIYDLQKLYQSGRDAMADVVRYKIRTFGSSGKV